MGDSFHSVRSSIPIPSSLDEFTAYLGFSKIFPLSLYSPVAFWQHSIGSFLSALFWKFYN